MNNLKIAVIFFFITLGVYALVLWLDPALPLWIPSDGYHFLILVFPLVLIVFHRESRSSLGLQWGKWKIGIPAALVVAAITLTIYWFLDHRLVIPKIDHFLFAAVIWGPVGEELIFRGYLQPKLEGLTGKWAGLVITALLFGVAHLPKIYFRQAAMPLLVPEAVLLGFIFGLIRDRTGSIYYGAICHMAYNLIVTVV